VDNGRVSWLTSDSRVAEIGMFRGVTGFGNEKFLWLQNMCNEFNYDQS
jgi:hypothetical protein